jgi:hypothetical protein
MYLTPSFVIASIVLYGVIGAAEIAVGTRLSERASPSSDEPFSARFAIRANDDTFSARFAIPRASDDEAAAYRPHVDVGFIEADVDRAERAPQSFAMRFGLVELLPLALTQFATGESASLRASLEAAGAAAIGATTPATAAGTANPLSHLR